MTTDNQQETGGGFLGSVSDDWQADRAKTAVTQLTSLVDPERYVGDLISLEYFLLGPQSTQYSYTTI